MTTRSPANLETVNTGIPAQPGRQPGLIAMSESAPAEAAFSPRTPVELLEDIIVVSRQNKLDPAELTYEQQPAFAQTAHGVINRYFCAQHQAEWAADTPHAIAPPLPFQYVSSRLSTYYSMVHKGDSDKVHQNTIKELRKQRLHYAVDMADALPEIAAAIDIQAALDDAGNEIAADAIGDLLVVYGITIFHLKEKQAKLRQEKLAKAERAAKAVIDSELLQ